jgi:hypothetical protein
MSAVLYPITIEKRACFDLPLTLTNSYGSAYNLSGVNLTGQIRRNFDNALQATFIYSVVNSGTASVKLSLTSGQTYNMDVAPSSYDVFLDASGCSDRILYGPVTISGNYTS